jgi:hypothetical protein
MMMANYGNGSPDGFQALSPSGEAVLFRKEDFPMTTTSLAGLKKLTISEILGGLLLYGGKEKFPEQALYRFFQKVGDTDPELAERFQVSEGQGRLKSTPLRRALSFFEMGKILELPMPNPVDQYYRARQSQRESLKRDLTRRGIIPSNERLFEDLAEEFRRVVAAN